MGVTTERDNTKAISSAVPSTAAPMPMLLTTVACWARRAAERSIAITTQPSGARGEGVLAAAG